MKSYAYRPARKRRSRPRAAWGAAIFSVITVYVTTLLLWPLPAVEATLTPLPPITTEAKPLAWPGQGSAAIGSTRDGVLTTQTNPETAVSMASITKVITALTVLDAKPLAAGESGPVITLSAADATRYNEYVAMNGSVARASEGQQITQRQIIEAMLIASANNYADTLALWAYSTPEAYLAAANDFLQKHGLSDTTIMDMTGFSPENKSTPSDLIKLGALALKHPVISEIVSQKNVTIPDVGTLQNTNILLGTNGINGIKTGTTDEAGSCLLFSAEHNVGGETITLIGVILGAPNHPTLFNQVQSLLASAQANFQQVTTLEANQKVGKYTTSWGASAEAVAKNSQTHTAWAETKISRQVALKDVIPSKTIDSAGAITTKLGDQTYTTEVRLTKPLTGPSWHWRLTHPLEIF